MDREVEERAVGDGCGGTGGGVQFHVGEGASSVEFLQHTLLFLSIKKTFMVYYLAGWSVLATPLLLSLIFVF